MKAVQLKYPGNDSGPCVPAALAKILGVPFEVINAYLIEIGARRYGRGQGNCNRLVGGTQTRSIPMKQIGLTKCAYEEHTVDVQDELVGQGFRVTGSHKKNITVNQFAKSHPTGSYLITVHHHGLAVVDGVIFDVQKDSTKKRVDGAWQQTHSCLVDWESLSKKVIKPVAKKGDKTKAIIALLSQGINSTKVLMERTNASYIYTRRVVVEYNKTQAQ